MRMPPVEKVYEAWTAIADSRIQMEENSATVKSSDAKKQYHVRWNGDKYTSDDNATFWQGYPGYPVLAVLMLQGRLPLNHEYIQNWKNINWTELNKRFHNNYPEAVAEIERERGIDPILASENASRTMSALEELNLEIKRKI